MSRYNYSTATLEKCIHSDSAAGPDKISLQHLKEVLTRHTEEASSRLFQALTTMDCCRVFIASCVFYCMDCCHAFSIC